jgi:hypothetical protein
MPPMIEQSNLFLNAPLFKFDAFWIPLDGGYGARYVEHGEDSTVQLKTLYANNPLDDLS